MAGNNFLTAPDQELIDSAHLMFGEPAIGTEDFAVLARIAETAIIRQDPDFDGKPGEYGLGNLELNMMVKLLEALKARAARN